MARRITFYFFITVVLLAPLPFASNRPWSWSLLSVFIGVLMIMDVLTSRDSADTVWRFLVRLLPGLILMGSLILWIWLQTMVSLSADMVHPLWSEMEALIGIAPKTTISLDPEATKSSLMRLLAYAGVFWVAARFCRDSENAAFVLKAFVIASSIYAIYGLVIYFADLKMILWFDKWAYLDDLTSTFVNRNTYATFAGLGLIASVGLMFDLTPNHLAGNVSRKTMFRVFTEWAFSRAWLPLMGVLLMATALLLSHSRGGFLSAFLALIVLLASVSYAKLLPRKVGFTLISMFALGSLFVLSLSGDIIDQRLARTSLDTSIRDEVYERVIDAIPSSPLLGTGYGTFEQAFRAYKTPVLSVANWDKAHNSYLELAMELGLPALAAFILLFLWLSGVFLSGLIRRGRRKIYAAIGLAATVLVAAHALVDFSLQIPGFTVTYALLAGLAWAQSWPTRQRARQRASRTDRASLDLPDPAQDTEIQG